VESRTTCGSRPRQDDREEGNLRIVIVGLGLMFGWMTAVSRAEILTNDLVVGAIRAGLSEQVLVEKIRLEECQFDKSVDALIELKNAGAPNGVIEAILARECEGTAPEVENKAAAPIEPKERPRESICGPGLWGSLSYNKICVIFEGAGMQIVADVDYPRPERRRHLVSFSDLRSVCYTIWKSGHPHGNRRPRNPYSKSDEAEIYIRFPMVINAKKNKSVESAVTIFLPEKRVEELRSFHARLSSAYPEFHGSCGPDYDF
jgi:hypothetical protein